jgi:hypothetical protein
MAVFAGTLVDCDSTVLLIDNGPVPLSAHVCLFFIEMNEARELYLHTYGTIDQLDHLIQNCCMSYR